jgi:molecular chaperone DnaK
MNDDRDVLQGQRIMGIDLGTTKSAISFWDDAQGRSVLLTDEAGRCTMPSMVGWDETRGDWVVGHEAKDLAADHPDQVAYSIKRYIGRRFTDPGLRRDRPRLGYAVASGVGTDQLRDVAVDFGPDGAGGRRLLTAPDISSRVLDRLRHYASVALGLAPDQLTHAVITVPAYFNVLQRQATILAGQLAGLDVDAILNEPTAAALAYCALETDLLGPQEKRLLVYDLGGGTFDISLLEARRDKKGYAFYTVAVDGDTRLGGDDIDAAVARWLAGELEQRYGLPVRQDDAVTWARLRRGAERAKIALSTAESYAVNLPAVELGDRTPFDAQVEITRRQLESSAAQVIDRTRKITRRVVEDVAGLSWDEIDHVILAGGQVYMPAVRRAVEEVTGRPSLIAEFPERLVAIGAGEYAQILSHGHERFNHKVLVNVLALPLGIRLDADRFKPLVPANATIPHRSAPYYVTTTEANQTTIHLEVLQGARGIERAGDCEVIGGIDMEVPPAPAGAPKFEVIFDVKTDGTMKVLLTDVRRKRPAESIDIVTERAWRDQPSDPGPEVPPSGAAD